MILKIATTEMCRPCAWWYIDDVRRLTQHTLTSREDYEARGVDADIVFLEDATEMVRLMTYRTTDGKERSIAFNTVAFLLNDEGKTIEKIVGS